MLEKNKLSRRDFIKFGLGTTTALGLNLLLTGCESEIIRIHEEKSYNINIDTFSTNKISPINTYPVFLKIKLLEDLDIFISEDYYKSKGYYKDNPFQSVGKGSRKIYENKTPTEPRGVKFYNDESEGYFLINGTTTCDAQSDSSGRIEIELTPNYNSKSKIPLNLNDIVNKEISSAFTKISSVTNTKIKMDGGNTVTSLSLEILTIEEGNLRNILSSYSSKDFNSKIKEFTLYLRDIDSRVDLPEVKLKIKGENIPNQPQQNQDFARLFKGDLLKYAESLSIGSQFKDYVKNEEITFMSDNNGKIQIPVYLGAQYSIELIHPKYNFAQEKITFDTRTPNEIPILMSELGTKVRLEILKNK